MSLREVSMLGTDTGPSPSTPGAAGQPHNGSRGAQSLISVMRETCGNTMFSVSIPRTSQCPSVAPCYAQQWAKKIPTIKFLNDALRMVTEKGVVCAEILKSQIRVYHIPNPWPPKSLSFTPLVTLFHSPCLGFNPDVPLFHPPGSLRDTQSLQYSTEGACLFGTFSPQAI
jgi:hypothetical protein